MLVYVHLASRNRSSWRASTPRSIVCPVCSPNVPCSGCLCADVRLSCSARWPRTWLCRERPSTPRTLLHSASGSCLRVVSCVRSAQTCHADSSHCMSNLLVGPISANSPSAGPGSLGPCRAWCFQVSGARPPASLPSGCQSGVASGALFLKREPAVLLCLGCMLDVHPLALICCSPRAGSTLCTASYFAAWL